MARLVARLTEQKIRALNKRGYYPDGGGLYLQVRDGGVRSWVYRFALNGRTRDAGLGSLADVSLVAARAKAAEYRALRDKGIDPIEHMKITRASGKIAMAAPAGPTFQEFAEECIEGWRQDWKNEKHAEQWRATLERYAYPVLGDMAISAIDTKDVLAVLKPMWREKSETMSRVRGRIERVLAAASVEGMRQGNPAVWKGHLSEAKGLGKKRKAAPFKAIPYAGLPTFLADLRAREGVAAAALEFLILCAARTNEVIGARFSEIDEAESQWLIPGNRMKAGREHIVPLSAAALSIIAEMKRARGIGDGFIFPGAVVGRPLSSMAMLECVRGLRGMGSTVHGFRATFKTWAEEETGHANSVIEAALAHIIGDKTERSYMRGDWLAKRRALMNDWADLCTSAPVETMVPIRIPA